MGQSAGTGAAERIGLEDGARCAAQVVFADAADEARHVDAGRAGLHARRVVAIEAALGLDQGLSAREAWRGIGEGRGVGGGVAAVGADVGAAVGRKGSGLCHAALPSGFERKADHLVRSHGDLTQPPCQVDTGFARRPGLACNWLARAHNELTIRPSFSGPESP